MASLRRVRRTGCQQKRRFLSMTEACGAAAAIRQHAGDHMQAYGCRHCKGFHLGHKPGWLRRKEQLNYGHR